MGGQDLSIYAGDSRQLLITVYNSANAVIDLTGAFLRYVLAQGTTPVITKTTLNGGIVITAATSGQLTVYISSNDTQGLLGTYTHQLRMIDTAGDSSIVMTGTVTVLASQA